jgi:hypothetical protein
LAGNILTTDQNGQTETVIYTYPDQIQQFQLAWITILMQGGKLKNRPFCVFGGWGTLCGHLYRFLISGVDSAVTPNCCYSVTVDFLRFILFFRMKSNDCMTQNQRMQPHVSAPSFIYLFFGMWIRWRVELMFSDGESFSRAVTNYKVSDLKLVWQFPVLLILLWWQYSLVSFGKCKLLLSCLC